jgi:hypothetical protein
MMNEQEYLTLDELFALARQQDPLLSQNEVVQIISGNRLSKSSKSGVRNFIKSHLKIIVMTSLTTLIITALLLLNNNADVKQNTTIQNNAAPIQRKTAKSSIVVESPVLRKSEFAKTAKVTVGNDRKDTTDKQFSENLGDSAPSKQPIQSNIINGDDYILELTNEELKHLGFFVTDSGVSYLSIDSKGMINSLFFKNPEMPDFRNGQRPFFYNKEINEIVISPSRPIYISEIQVSRFQQLKYFMPKIDIDPKCLTKYGYLKRGVSGEPAPQIFESLDTLFKRVKSSRNKLVFIDLSGLDFPEYMTKEFEKDYPLNIDDDSLVALKINTPYFKKLFWFPLSDDFIELLPERLKSKYKQFIENVKNTKKTFPNADVVKYFTICNTRNLIESMNFIQLSKNELLRLGLKYSEQLDYKNLRYANNFTTFFNGQTEVFFSQDKDSIDLNKGLVLISVSDKNGYCWKSGNPIQENSTIQNIQELVPILLSKDSFRLFPLNQDKILWFVPNQAFFDSLPPAIGNELRKEYNIVQMLHDPSFAKEQKAELPTTCKYFEECKSNLYEIDDIELFPNPAKDFVNLRFKATRATNITVMLYDIMGRPVSQLQASTQVPLGSHQFQLSLAYVNKGIFLLHIRNTEGNYKTIRLIKE